MPYKKIGTSYYGTRKLAVMKRNPYGSRLNKRQKNTVKRLIANRQELKYKDYFVDTNVSASGFFQGIMDVDKGDDSNQRDGDSLQLCGRLEMRLRVINSDPTVGDDFNNIRVIVFQWHPASTPAITDILADGPFAGGYDYLSNYNHLTRAQYTILFDKTWSSTNNTAESLQYEFQQNRHYFISLKKARKIIKYTPAGTLFGTNRLYILALSDSSTVDHPNLTLTIRGVFRDS